MDTIFVDVRNAIDARDAISRMGKYRAAIMAGAMSVNDARLAEGLEPVPGGDAKYHPINTDAIDADVPTFVDR